MSAVADIRAALARLPEDAGVIVEDDYGRKYRLLDVFAIGWNTDDPGLVLKIRELPIIDVQLGD